MIQIKINFFLDQNLFRLKGLKKINLNVDFESTNIFINFRNHFESYWIYLAYKNIKENKKDALKVIEQS